MIRVILTGLLIALVSGNLCWGQAGTTAPRVLTLDECMKLAEKHNATLISARESYNVAKSDVWLGWGKLLPGVSSRLGYNHSETWSPGGGDYNPVTESIDSVPPGGIASKYYSASVSAGQSWSLGGYNFYEIREKNASRNSARSSYELTRQELILAVKQAYFDVLKAKMLLAIQEKALNRASEQLKIAEARYELGAASYSDVLKAKVLHGDVKLALIGAENSVKLAKASLNSWMGQDVDTDVDVEENLTVPGFNYSYDHALQGAMRDNPNMTTAKFNLKSAEAQFGMARSGLFPNFGVSGSYSWDNEDLDEIKNIRRRDYRWSLSAYVSFNIFENFTKKHNLSYAKANLNSQRQNFHQTERDVALELKQAFLNVEEAQEKIKLTEEKVESAQEDLDLMQEKYNLGAASILELLDAEVSFKQAESDQVEALYDYNLAVAQFEKAMGK